MAIYVPRVLICGDDTEFRKIIGDKPVEIVGRIIFEQTDDEVSLFYDGRILTDKDISSLLAETAEYIVFIDAMELYFFLKTYKGNTQILSATAFANKISDGFFSFGTLEFLKICLGHKNFTGRVLDLDCHFAKSGWRMNDKLSFRLECISENLPPIMENLYGKIYRSFDECRYHIFDAILLTKERTPEEFINVIIDTDNLSEKIFAFIRRGSKLEKWLNDSQYLFAQIDRIDTPNGAWCLIKKLMPPVNVGVYVVTHKDIKLDSLPEDYRIIHAGHAQAKKDFGYIGDDTGENISELNRYLDEVTALYWIWKNTNHTHAGFVHYRRFLTSKIQPGRLDNRHLFSVDDILSAEEIQKLLRDYDIIVSKEFIADRTQLELMILSTKQPDLVRISEKIIRHHIELKQPDYLDAYDDVISDFVFFPYGVFITRRNIFNAYCEWLFSFMLDATQEMRDKVIIFGHKLEEMPHGYSRIMSFFSERMLTVWLIKNHLRIKALPIMYREDV